MESGHPEVQGAHEEGNGLVVDSFDKWRYEHYFGFSAWKDKSTMVKLISSHAMLLAQLQLFTSVHTNSTLTQTPFYGVTSNEM